LNAELCKKALEKIGNPNVLVNLISRRVRQLSTGGGSGRPLVADVAGLGLADIALKELVENKMGWEAIVDTTNAAEVPVKRRRRS
jgi:DNA-directed RNA polymerase subunit omega